MRTSDGVPAEVYNRYYNKVFGYVLNRVRSRADAEDITADVFLKIFSKAEDFDPDRPGASSYIFRVMQNTLTDFYRKSRFVLIPMEEMADEADETADRDALLLALDNALDTLPEREQAIVILHYYHGLSHKEIAQKMNLSYGNVRQLCHGALNKLRRELAL